jgi:hypothetical protein
MNLEAKEAHELECDCPDCLADRPQDFRHCDVCARDVYWENTSACYTPADEIDHHICHGCESRGFA